MDFSDGIQKSFSNVRDINIDIEQAEEKIVDNFEKGFLTEELFCEAMTTLEKSMQASPVGTIRNGFKKIAPGVWQPLDEIDDVPESDLPDSNGDLSKEGTAKQRTSESVDTNNDLSQESDEKMMVRTAMVEDTDMVVPQMTEGLFGQPRSNLDMSREATEKPIIGSQFQRASPPRSNANLSEE